MEAWWGCCSAGEMDSGLNYVVYWESVLLV